MVLTKSTTKSDFNKSIIYSNEKYIKTSNIDTESYDEKYKSLTEANELNKSLLKSFLVRLKLLDIVNQNWS